MDNKIISHRYENEKKYNKYNNNFFGQFAIHNFLQLLLQHKKTKPPLRRQGS